jgi:hypothetical protein
MSGLVCAVVVGPCTHVWCAVDEHGAAGDLHAGGGRGRPLMMEELRRIWHLLDVNCIMMRPRYIRSIANMWAKPSHPRTRLRRLATQSARLPLPRLPLGPCSTDRFATMENAQLLRFNARWRDPKCELVDCLRLRDN